MQHTGAYSSQLEAKLKSFGATPAGAAWVSKALHPVVGEPRTIPDQSNCHVLNPEYKLETQISAPSGLSTTLWDALILVPPADYLGAVIMTGNAGADFYLGAASPAPVLSTNWITASEPLMGTLGGVNGWWQALATGAISAATGYTVSRVRDSSFAESWRIAAKSTTLYMTASSLFNGGTIYAAQYNRPVDPALSGVIDPTTPSMFSIDNIDHVSLPLSEAEMAVMTPGFYTAPAKEGVYMPLRLLADHHPFVRSRTSPRYLDYTDTSRYFVPSNFDGGVTANLETNSLFMVRSHTDDTRNADCPAYLKIPAGTSRSSMASAGFDTSCSWGVIIVRGLHPECTLTLKTNTTLEVQPKVMCPSRQYIKNSGRYDPQALLAYDAICSEVPHAMAAEHNFFGTLLPILSSIAGKVLPHVLPAVGAGLATLVDRVRGAPAPPPPLAIAPPPMVQPSVRRASSVASRRSVGSTRRVKVKVGKKKSKPR